MCTNEMSDQLVLVATRVETARGRCHVHRKIEDGNTRTHFLQPIDRRTYDNYVGAAIVGRVAPDAFSMLGGLGESGNLFILVRIDDARQPSATIQA
jgi:hypothetical protein